MTIQDIINALENWAPRALQESYDNCGLLTGQPHQSCTGVLCTLDCLETTIDEAIARGANLVVAHHPIIFKGLKQLSGNDYVTRTVVKAIENRIAIYAIHTNLDNTPTGINFWLARQLGLTENSLQPLRPMAGWLQKLTVFVPTPHAETLRQALFAAGAGHVGQYQECSFNTEGQGSFRPLAGANPVLGQAGGPQEWVQETRVEMVFPAHRQQAVLRAMQKAHPYETVAYDVITVQNAWPDGGAGLVGSLATPVAEAEWLLSVKEKLGLPMVKHTQTTGRLVHKVAVCGGAGSFLLPDAIAAGADSFITSDLKYHEYFDADNKLLLVDVGHFESEQFAIDGLAAHLQAIFPTFAVLKTGLHTNPVHYLV